MTWQDVAPCRGLTRLFFAPEHENLEQRRLRLAEARAVCRGCEFRAECAAQGADEPFGVWAGEPHEPQHGGVRGGAGAHHRGIIETGHGTLAGYKQHLRDRSPQCGPCAAAGTDYRLARRQIQRADWTVARALRAAAQVESWALRGHTDSTDAWQAFRADNRRTA